MSTHSSVDAENCTHPKNSTAISRCLLWLEAIMTTKERLAQSCLIFQQAPFFILPLPEFIGVKLSKNYRKTNILKVIMRWKCEFLNRWLLARGWQSSIPHVWVERRKSCQCFPCHLCSSHFYNTFSALANWEKLLHFPVFLEKKVPHQNLFFKREGIVQFFILP